MPNFESLIRVSEQMTRKILPRTVRCVCNGSDFSTVFRYEAPPNGETQFGFCRSGSYRRDVLRCAWCGHFVSYHEMDDKALYTGSYVSATYGDEGGLRAAFDRIMTLPEEQSDNAGRVRRVLEFAARRFSNLSDSELPPSILDVGSGLCVFLSRMKALGWNCTALDPDCRATEHAERTVGVRAVCGDFMTVEGVGQFNAVTFNKVLEHVNDPVAMLARSARFLNDDGFVYVEVPDGEAAVRAGSQREEFFVEHLHIFSAASLAVVSSRSGLSLSRIERVREPSGKFTLLAFLALEKQRLVTNR